MLAVVPPPDLEQLPPGIAAQRLLDVLTTAVLLADADGRVLYLNAAAEDLLGTSAQRSSGTPLDVLIESDGGLTDLFRHSAATGGAYSRREVPLYAASRTLMVDCRVTPAGDAGDASVLLVELHDAAPRVRIRRDATLLAQREVTRKMILQLAHEIKNPLGGLRGAAQLLERALPDRSLTEYTQVIISEADRLRDLVDELLGPGRPPRRVNSNVHELLQHVYRLVAAEAPPGVTVRRDYDPSLPLLSLDRTQMIQALLNLAKNALQAVGTTGTLVLRTRARTNVTLGGVRHRLVASLEIEDDGPGIPDELQETIFYPLVTGRADGTGLGLPLAQELVNRHGGLIEFDSRPGRTVFRVGLPIEEESQDGE